MKLKYFFSLLLLIGVLSCKPTSSVVTNRDKSIVPEEVDLNDLIFHRGQHHRKWIQVTGKFMYGEETIAIASWKEKNPGFVFSEYDAIWLSFDPVIHKKHIDDSLEIWKGKLLTVKGYFDSSKQGHMGMYAGTLVNTYDIQPAK